MSLLSLFLFLVVLNALPSTSAAKESIIHSDIPVDTTGIYELLNKYFILRLATIRISLS